MKRSKTVGDDINLHDVADDYKCKGNELFKLQDFKLALDWYEKAIATFFDDTVYHANRAACLLKLERYEESIVAAENALKLDGTNAKGYYRLSQAYEGLGEDAKALQFMTKAVQFDAKCRGDLERLKKKVSNYNFEVASKVLEKKVWLPLSKNQKYINFINKNPNYRSKKTMKRIKIDEVQPSKMPTVCDAGEKIPDSVIDKLFNNNTGECTSDPLPSRHTLDFGAFYRRRTKSPPKEQDVRYILLNFIKDLINVFLNLLGRIGRYATNTIHRPAILQNMEGVDNTKTICISQG